LYAEPKHAIGSDWVCLRPNQTFHKGIGDNQGISTQKNGV